MSALVGVLNRNAAVIAADSALRIASGNICRTGHNCTRIFRLSEKYPVAVMAFNAVNLMGVPIKLLADRYREKRGNEGFKTLRGYADNFIRYLDGEEPMLRDSRKQHDCLREESHVFFQRVRRLAHAFASTPDYGKNGSDPSENDFPIEGYYQEALCGMEGICGEHARNQNFGDWSFERFLEYADEEIDALMAYCEDEEDELPTGEREDWESGLYHYIVSNLFFEGTGLVFVGYGSEDIYPSLVPVYISGYIDGRFRFSFSENENRYITARDGSAIVPFSEIDVMESVMKGISPFVWDKIEDASADLLARTKDKICSALKEAGVDRKTIGEINWNDIIDGRKEYLDDLKQYIQEEYLDDLLSTLETYSVEEMANLAKGLVDITKLQRQFTSADDSVGGLVDVAVLTREHGFVWLQHRDWAGSCGLNENSNNIQI